MASPQRKQTLSVGERLFQEPYAFDFHQALKILDTLNPRTVLLGEGVIPMREAVALKSRIFLTPAPSQLSTLVPGHRMQPATLHVNFFGLAGEAGPLPMPYVEMLMERLSNRDPAMADFLDIFNHRLLSLVARNGRKHWPALTKGRPETSPMGRVMVALSGMTCLEKTTIPNLSLQSFLPYTNVLWNVRPTTGGMTAMLKDFFQEEIKIKEFVGIWRPLEKQVQTRIGDGVNRGDNHRLGESATLGTRYWDQAGRIEVIVGPLLGEVPQKSRRYRGIAGDKKWRHFLPTGIGWPRLQTLLKGVLPPHMDVRIVLKVAGNALKGTRLTGQQSLGWETTLGPSRQTEQIIPISPHFFRSVKSHISG